MWGAVPSGTFWVIPEHTGRGATAPSAPHTQSQSLSPRHAAVSSQKLEQEREDVDGDSEDPHLVPGKSPAS